MSRDNAGDSTTRGRAFASGIMSQLIVAVIIGGMTTAGSVLLIGERVDTLKASMSDLRIESAARFTEMKIQIDRIYQDFYKPVR